MLTDFTTKEEMLDKLRAYTSSPDDDVLNYKEKIRSNLLSCPELLYALNNSEYENELFDKNGNLNEDGDWSLYYGDNIRPYIYFDETQTYNKNFIAYKVEFTEIPRYNSIEKYGQITFTIYCNSKDNFDKSTGVPRHDLIGAIVREHFNWTNIFGIQCKLVSNKEGITDSFVTRTLIFQTTNLNSILKTTNGTTRVINREVRT